MTPRSTSAITVNQNRKCKNIKVTSSKLLLAAHTLGSKARPSAEGASLASASVSHEVSQNRLLPIKYVGIDFKAKCRASPLFCKPGASRRKNTRRLKMPSTRKWKNIVKVCAALSDVNRKLVT